MWKTIEEERVAGYEHRAPNKKQKKDQLGEGLHSPPSGSGCLLLNKITVKKIGSDN